MGEIMDGQVDGTDALVFGRKMCQIFAADWPNVETDAGPVAAKLNSMPKYVASRTLDEVEWNDSTFLSGDTTEAAETLKHSRGGNMMLFERRRSNVQNVYYQNL